MPHSVLDVMRRPKLHWFKAMQGFSRNDSERIFPHSVRLFKMDRPSFKKISEGELRGWLREDLLSLLPPGFFNDPVSVVQERGGKIIKKSKLRWAAILTLPSGRRVFFKRDKTKGWLECLKFLVLPSKARKEWFIAYQLKKRKLNIPQPLGWMERVHQGLVKESYYLSEAIESGASFIEDSNLARDASVTAELAKTVKEIHDRGLFHKDLHGGNFLWDGKSFFLTDLHRARIVRSLSLNQRLWNLSQLFHSLRSQWEERQRVEFIEKYFEKEAFHLEKKEALLGKVHSLMGRLQKRQRQSRTKRCLKESTHFSIQRGRGIRYYHRREYPSDQIQRVVEAHLSFVKEKPSSLAKYSPEVAVSILDTGTLITAGDVIPAPYQVRGELQQELRPRPRESGEPGSNEKTGFLAKPAMTSHTGMMASFIEDGEKKVCVKQFCYPNSWDRFKERFRRSKGLKAWVSGNGLIARGIPSLSPFALVERRDWLGLKESFLLMEASETGQELDRYLFRGFKDVKEKRLFIKAFAQWVSYLHKMDLYHKDMKTCNILVAEKGETWDFRLLDWEDLLLDQRINFKELSRNLLQLNASTPRIITRTDRLRFLHQYLLHRPVAVDKKRLVKEVDQKTRKRGTVYVAPWGVVGEGPDIPATYRAIKRPGIEEVLRSAGDGVPVRDAE
jgi:tRNA A-37 threonylcarbamoyl transferase component Bud32